MNWQHQICWPPAMQQSQHCSLSYTQPLPNQLGCGIPNSSCVLAALMPLRTAHRLHTARWRTSNTPETTDAQHFVPASAPWAQQKACLPTIRGIDQQQPGQHTQKRNAEKPGTNLQHTSQHKSTSCEPILLPQRWHCKHLKTCPSTHKHTTP